MQTTNISQKRRQEMLDFLETLKAKNQDDKSLCAITQIQKELNGKKYGLVWEEHKENVDFLMQENLPVFKEKTAKKITTQKDAPYNFLLEGDNLECLYLLQKTHSKKIDVIYIDPPYNTGNKDFKYSDSFVEKEDAFRHSKWLSFMQKRLALAQTLLKDTGVILISIDDNEQAALKLLCDEIFGEENFVDVLHWKKKKQPSFLANHTAKVMEYVLVYSKNKVLLNKLSIETISDATKKVINLSNAETTRHFNKGVRVKIGDSGIIPKGVYTIKTMTVEYKQDVNYKNGRTTNEVDVVSKFCVSQEKIDKYIKDDLLFITVNSGLRRDVSQQETAKTKAITDLLLDYGDNQDSNNEINNLFNARCFDYAKPVKLIYNLIKSTQNPCATVLDFFAGSGTTGQAVLELNKDDGGQRKFILCTNNENNICQNVTYQRLKTVITGTRQDGTVYSCGIQSNLKYFNCEWLPKEQIQAKRLCDNVKELIELENSTDIDQKTCLMVLKESELDTVIQNWQALKNTVKTIYYAQNIMLSKNTLDTFQGVSLCVIPEYYFKAELQKTGEEW